MKNSIYRRFGKRLFDLAIAIPALVILSPVLLIVGILVRFKLGSPILFRQPRPGYRGQLFTICKFRTMINGGIPDGKPLTAKYDHVRITPFGKFLRSSSLDELPELWNVVIGQMSLVGPRPLKEDYLPLYTPDQARRHDVIPGVTGWAQINGRNGVTWEERFQHDLWYVENMSFGLDLWILFRTVAAVFDRNGISAEGHASMPDFEGTSNLALANSKS